LTVLDASALLAFLFAEAGGESVGRVLGESCVSTVNLSEVLARFARDGHDPAAVSARIAATSLEIVPFTARQAELAAAILPACRPLGLALGDRACLALAIDRAVPAWTADRVWLDLDVNVEIRAIR
jgi:ribonuclease VapC